MTPSPLTTPVALLIFRRPEQTVGVFGEIRAARPGKLLIIADGPRPGRADDVPAVAQTRAIVDRVDWPCEVLRNYARHNLGSKARVVSGLNWVFEQVDRAIVLEDDCLPHPGFFPFCQELLDRYRDDERIGWISGADVQMGRHITADSYHFARNAHIWGWATWRDRWKSYDASLTRWPQLRESGWLRTLFDDPQQINVWTQVFDRAYRGETSWDVPWLFSTWASGRFNVVPNVNLVSNVGLNDQATGQFDEKNPVFHAAGMPLREIHFPLRHPAVVAPLAEADEFSLRCIPALDVQYLRAKFAESWSDPTFTDRATADWPLAAVKAISSGARLIPLSPQEQHKADMLMNSMATEPTTSIDLNDPKALQQFLAKMLYLRADQMPGLPLDLEKVPDWFSADYVKYLHEPPQIFTQPGGSERYAAFLERWIDAVWEHVQGETISQLWWDAATQFVQFGNFIGVYFSRQNLKSLYEKRGRLIELVLGRMGNRIDHTFPARPADRIKVRLGVLASHFAPQTETYTTLPAFKHLNRDKYEIILFATHQSGHRMERYCSGHADNFVTLPGDLAGQVNTIRGWDLDVLWIGTNVTAVSNWVTLLAAHRLGRVQVTSTSSCVTTGMRNVEYYVSGSLCEPADAQSQYTERLLLMDGPAHCMDLGCEAKRLPAEKVSREEIGVKKDEVLFASGANFFKIIPEVEAVWTEILKRVPNGKLLLYPFNPNWSDVYPAEAFVNRFRKSLESQGMSGDRVVVLKPAPSRADVHNRLRLADIYLDSFPFSGVNSLLDPLEVALPPVVMEGNSFRSLMAPSLMRELNVPELIANDESQYIDLAVKLANDSSARSDYARRIGDAMVKRPRFIDSQWYSSEADRLLAPILAERGIWKA